LSNQNQDLAFGEASLVEVPKWLSKSESAFKYTELLEDAIVFAT